MVWTRTDAVNSSSLKNSTLRACSYTIHAMSYHFSVIIMQGKDGMFTAHVPGLRGCHTQAKSLSVLHKRLQEAMELCLEVEQRKRQPIQQDKFIAVQQMEVTV